MIRTGEPGIVMAVQDPGAGVICINRYLIGQTTSDELGPRKAAPSQERKFGAEVAPP